MRCPHCGATLEPNMVSVTGGAAIPRDGDLTICVDCGEWAAFSGGVFGPLDWQQVQYTVENPDARRLRSAWLLAREEPETTLASEWDEFCETTMKRVPARGLKLCRSSFFAGALVAFNLMLKAREEEDADKADIRVARLRSEIIEYAEQFKER